MRNGVPSASTGLTLNLINGCGIDANAPIVVLKFVSNTTIIIRSGIKSISRITTEEISKVRRIRLERGVTALHHSNYACYTKSNTGFALFVCPISALMLMLTIFTGQQLFVACCISIAIWNWA